MAYDNNEYINSINYCIVTNNQLLQNLRYLPVGCTIQPHEENDTSIVIDIAPGDNGVSGFIVLVDPHWTNGGQFNVNGQEGFAYVMCGISNHNGYIMELVVQNISALIEILTFFKQVAEYQDDNEDVGVGFIRVPQHLRNQWFIPEHARHWRY
jgi:hypothetical protein